jgi:hypothetical protein
MREDIWSLIGSSSVSFMLSFMLMTAWLPFAPQRPGEVLLRVPLGLFQRLLVHRAKAIWMLAIVVLLSALGPLVFGRELLIPGTPAIALTGFLAILMLPMRYVFTDRGVSINNGVPRTYKGFRRFDVKVGQRWLRDTATIVLHGRKVDRGTVPPYVMFVPVGVQGEVVKLLKKHVR